MKKSRYFSDLFRNYNDEVDDLVTDSEGKSVLQKRLNEKRREIEAIMPMIEFSPEMVSVVFYGAFAFTSPEIMQRIALSQPGRPGFLAWRTLKKELAVADWAQSLIDSTLKTQGGDAFLVATAALEYLRLNGSSTVPALEIPEAEEAGEKGDAEDESEDEGDGADDLSEAGADWLAEQGFETLDH